MATEGPQADACEPQVKCASPTPSSQESEGGLSTAPTSSGNGSFSSQDSQRGLEDESSYDGEEEEADYDDPWRRHPFGREEMERQRMIVAQHRARELDCWIGTRRAVLTDYYGYVGNCRNRALINEAQRHDLDVLQRRGTPELHCRVKWGNLAEHIEKSQQAVGPECVMRVLSGMRLFVPGSLAESFMSDEHELARRMRHGNVLAALQEQGRLFL
eukprot:TRINITY_DN8673_c3_g1_i1.p1 TRINITY_DN8673_c3_g1~~TRINITY_DN8673_c3_g1_i1.p1  ORF type:complete len:242 (+),score=90.50 TRINITY_DN8673_c3_g1_i1:84-728(+)